MKEPKPPYCVCCEYINKCSSDKQKPDYCPDKNYQEWLLLPNWKKQMGKDGYPNNT